MARQMSVLKGSFPQSGVADSSKPSVSKVMKEMLQNQTPMGSSSPTKRVIESDSRRMPEHLPKSYLPKASSGPVPAADLNRQGAAFRGLGMAREEGGAVAERVWRPPGWKKGQEVENGPEVEMRPKVEVWGMRAVIFLVFAALYIEFKDASISPTGHITRKPRPQRHLTPQEEEEERERQLKAQKK